MDRNQAISLWSLRTIMVSRATNQVRLEEIRFGYDLKSTYSQLFAGNDFHGITIQSQGIIDRAKQENYPFALDNGVYSFKSPDGYTFFVKDEPTNGNGNFNFNFSLSFLFLDKISNQSICNNLVSDPVQKVALNCTNIEKTLHYWHDLLQLNVITKTNKSILLAYGESSAQLEFVQLGKCSQMK